MAGVMLSVMPVYLLLYYALFVPVGLAALIWGGLPERVVSSTMATALLATKLVQSNWVSQYQQLEVGVLVIDGGALAAFLLIALIADRWWTLWTAAFQIISTGAHVAKVTNPELLRAGYMVMVSASAYPHLLFLAIGTINEAARRRNRIVPLSWAGFSAGVVAAVRVTKPKS